MARGYGVGMSLAGYGQAQEQSGTRLLGEAAREEQTRNMENQRIEAQRKAGNQQLGATSGAMIGMQVGGPWGALIGGVIGGVAGGAFALLVVVLPTVAPLMERVS